MASRAVGHARLARRIGREGLTPSRWPWVGHPDGWVVSASRAATGLLTVLAHLRDANTLMVMKSASPRIYSDLRAAALLGGYYFHFTSLAPHLDFNDALPG